MAGLWEIAGNGIVHLGVLATVDRVGTGPENPGKSSIFIPGIFQDWKVL